MVLKQLFLWRCIFYEKYTLAEKNSLTNLQMHILVIPIFKFMYNFFNLFCCVMMECFYPPFTEPVDLREDKHLVHQLVQLLSFSQQTVSKFIIGFPPVFNLVTRGQEDARPKASMSTKQTTINCLSNSYLFLFFHFLLTFMNNDNSNKQRRLTN